MDLVSCHIGILALPVVCMLSVCYDSQSVTSGLIVSVGEGEREGKVREEMAERGDG